MIIELEEVDQYLMQNVKIFLLKEPQDKTNKKKENKKVQLKQPQVN